jgi:protein-disulfide isomerase
VHGLRFKLLASAVMLVIALAGFVARKRDGSRPYDLHGFGHEQGNPGASVVIIEFADFACGACAAFAEQTLPQVERDWIATGRARIRVIPLGIIAGGRSGGQAAHCAAEQDAFWPMHDLLYARRKEWLMRRGQRAKFESWARELGLNVTRFRECLGSDPWKVWLQENTRLAQTHGVPGTPAFVINGRPIVGALSYDQFAAALESASAPERSSAKEAR